MQYTLLLPHTHTHIGRYLCCTLFISEMCKHSIRHPQIIIHVMTSAQNCPPLNINELLQARTTLSLGPVVQRLPAEPGEGVCRALARENHPTSTIQVPAEMREAITTCAIRVFEGECGLGEYQLYVYTWTSILLEKSTTNRKLVVSTMLVRFTKKWSHFKKCTIFRIDFCEVYYLLLFQIALELRKIALELRKIALELRYVFLFVCA